MASHSKQKPDPIFNEFRKNTTMMSHLNHAINAIKLGYSRMVVQMLKVRETNARAHATFTFATCDTTYYCADQPLEAGASEGCFTAGSIFHDGLYALEGYVNDGKIPVEKQAQDALRKLLVFLNSSMLVLQKPETDDKCTWAVELAQHLLSALAVESKFTIDNHYSKAKLPKVAEGYSCACDERDLLVGSFGDTSFGCPEAWHGNADILMEDIAVTVKTEDNSSQETLLSEPSESTDNNVESSVDENPTDQFSGRNLWQMRAQCIVFSFLQKKQNNDLPNYLIPSFGFSKNNVIAHFYDCENDILLSCGPLNLFAAKGRLIEHVVVFIWLTLNYKWFCSGATSEMKEYSAKFFECAGDYLDTYKNDVQRPVPKGQTNIQIKDWSEVCGKLSIDPESDRVPKITLVDMKPLPRCSPLPQSHSPQGMDEGNDSDGDVSHGTKRSAPLDSGGHPSPKRSKLLGSPLLGESPVD